MKARNWFNPPSVTDGDYNKMYLENIIPPKLTLETRWNSIESESQEGGKPMTILIGALCENREKVILISDRMTSNIMTGFTFEIEYKYEELTDKAIVLFSGKIYYPELIENVKQKARDLTAIKEIAHCLEDNYRQVRNTVIQSGVFSRHGFTSFGEFHEKQRFLLPDISKSLFDEINKQVIGVDLLLGGVDKKAHIYGIREAGKYIDHNTTGFCCMGTGTNVAEPIFSYFGFSPTMSEEEVLIIGFEAKKMAETTLGVGKETDIWIIGKDKNGKGEKRKLQEEKIEALEKYCENKKDISKISQKIKKKEESENTKPES